MINIHTHHLSIQKNNTIDVYNQYPWDFKNNDAIYSIGIHPVFIDKSNLERDLLIIEKHIKTNNCIAIGEIGLDKLTSINLDLQKHFFEVQLQIAEEYKIPVIIHCVRAYQEIFEIRKKMKLSVPFIFHGFNKNKNLLQQILANNCIPSFGKNLLQNPNLQTIFANLSEEKFFLENDESQIPIQEIYQKAAELKNTSVENIVAITNNNFKCIFKQKIV